MKVKCVICERIDTLQDENPLAKKLRNRPIHTYLCDECNDRIATKTKENRDPETYRLHHLLNKEADF
ncbi:hypothetical protein Q73_04840 [Bacillus coahuilensis m2-6]|uniref:DUF2197 domain-containing protein n=1 Tax=Bacillus coahuilensis p1.1.43 TaxID=1150625 RepID=A0A147KAF7_9BACI|nr:YlaI family protein [Bacillus coahuilensis]KUP07663.1 hypothetical protein Q75_05405 [Bacillus coahuilensis p1.1.43]KUP08804.1 hypothetical protein Q73_04840 [Bacillus coahuilensis m2-6]